MLDKQNLKASAKTIQTCTKDNFPIIIRYYGKEYIIRKSKNGGLCMTKYEEEYINNVEIE